MHDPVRLHVIREASHGLPGLQAWTLSNYWIVRDADFRVMNFPLLAMNKNVPSIVVQARLSPIPTGGKIPCVA